MDRGPLLPVDPPRRRLWGQAVDQHPETAAPRVLDLVPKVEPVLAEQVSLEEVPPLGDDLREA
jgi:hypothetical protein